MALTITMHIIEMVEAIQRASVFLAIGFFVASRVESSSATLGATRRSQPIADTDGRHPCVNRSPSAPLGSGSPPAFARVRPE